jgi:signal transduction histidine kinase
LILNLLEDITPQKQMEMELREVQQRMIQGREDERLRLAQDLHDGPLQDLYAISYQLSSLWTTFGDPDSYPQIKKIEASFEHVISALRSMAGELRPPSLAPFGLEKAIRSHVHNLQESRPDLIIELELMPDRKFLAEPVRLALFRIYQTAISNVVRHSDARHIWIRFYYDEGQIELAIQDDGNGFRLPQRWVELVREGHYGLIGAAERAQAVGGHLIIKAEPGGGTEIRVVISRSQQKELAAADRLSFISQIINE